jgi:hypothetical protein
VPAVGDFGLEPSLFLLGLPVAAVDLPGDVALLAGEWVQAGVDEYLPAV